MPTHRKRSLEGWAATMQPGRRPSRLAQRRGCATERAPQGDGDPVAHTLSPSSVRAERSNPESLRGGSLDCFASLAMTEQGALSASSNSRCYLSDRLIDLSQSAKRGCPLNLSSRLANSCWKSGSERSLSISGSLIFQIADGKKPCTLSS